VTYSDGVAKVEWDPRKDLANQAKHGISFREASVLFTSGEDYLELFDAAHSVEEDRFVAIGPITRGLMLVVWTERDDDVVRIIRARRATPPERRRYHQNMEQQ
jgi:hypothetical protein